MMKLKIYFKQRKSNQLSFYYNSFIFNKFITSFLKNGKRRVFLKIIILLFKLIKNEFKTYPLIFIYIIIKLSLLSFNLFSIKKSGRFYQLARPINFNNQVQNAIKIIIKICLNNTFKSSHLAFYEEFVEMNKFSNRSKIQQKLNEIVGTVIENQLLVNYKKELYKILHLKKTKLKKYSFGYNKLDKFLNNLSKKY